MHVVDHGSGMFSPAFTGDDAPRAVSLTIAFTQHGEVCTADASAEYFPANLDIISTNPLFCSLFSCAQSPLVIFWEPSGGGAVAGSQSPR